MHKTHYFLGLFTALILFIASCQKDTLVTNVPHNQEPNYNWGQGDSIPIVAPFYFVGKIDSQLYTFQDSITNYFNYVYDSALIVCPDDTNMVFYWQSTGFYTLAGTNSLDIKFLVCADTTDTGLDSTNLDSLIGFGGTYPYGSSNKFDPIFGVEVSWVDAAGKVWKTDPGSGSNHNDSFFIQAIEDSPVDGLGFYKITGTMSVTLYNGLESISIEGGRFEMQYGVY